MLTSAFQVEVCAGLDSSDTRGARAMDGEQTHHDGSSSGLARVRLEIVNPFGLHLRAAEKLVRTALPFHATIRLVCDGRAANCRSILDLIALGAACGAWLDLEADGHEADAALQAVAALIERGFDETNA